MPPRGSTDPKVLLPPLLSLCSSNAYSAHQRTRTTASRLNSAGKSNEATEVLFEVAKEMLTRGELGSGVDLGLFMVQSMDDRDDRWDEAGEIARFQNLIALCPPTGTWRKSLIDACVNFTAKHGPNPTGDSTLHLYVGQLLFKEGAFETAERHLLSAGTRDAGKLLGEMMFEWCGKGSDDPSAYALRSVLPPLLLDPPSILPAKATLSTFLDLLISHDSSILLSKISPISSATAEDDDPSDAITVAGIQEAEGEFLFTSFPALNWLQLAIRTIQRAPLSAPGGQAKLWQDLASRYGGPRGFGRNVMKDEHIQEAIQHITTSAFKVQPPRGAPNMMDLMSSLFG